MYKINFSEHFSVRTGLFINQKHKGYTSSKETDLADQLFSGFGFGEMDDLDSLFAIPGINSTVYEKTTGIVSEVYLGVTYYSIISL